tara:strand:+ start:798 stop:1046 length:249 start_codon:yes stop_codon:yes gene_type:complete
MIDKKISLGTILTGATIIGTFIFTQGSTTTKIDSVEKEQTKVVKRVDNNSSAIVNLKIGQAKIETKLDDRFNRLEELIMDIE